MTRKGYFYLHTRFGNARNRTLKAAGEYAWILLSAVMTAAILAAGCMQATGSLTVRSVPEGARIAIDGIDNGTAPVLIADWPAGNYSAELKKAGYIDTFGTVSILAGKNGTAVITLPPIPMPADKTLSGVTDLNRRTTENIAYLGGFETGGGSTLGRVRFVIGKTEGETSDPFRCEGAGVMIVTKSAISQLSADSPLYLEGKDPAPGKWRIVHKINSATDNNIERNEQFTIVAVPAVALARDAPLSVEIRPGIGAAVNARIP
jgi:hypothetical protein